MAGCPAALSTTISSPEYSTKGYRQSFRERTCDRCISLASLGGFVYMEPEAITTEDELRHWITRGVAFTEQNVSTSRRRSR